MDVQLLIYQTFHTLMPPVQALASAIQVVLKIPRTRLKTKVTKLIMRALKKQVKLMFI